MFLPLACFSPNGVHSSSSEPTLCSSHSHFLGHPTGLLDGFWRGGVLEDNKVLLVRSSYLMKIGRVISSTTSNTSWPDNGKIIDHFKPGTDDLLHSHYHSHLVHKL